MNKYKRLLSNAAIFAIGTFSSKVMVYLLMPLYTNILSPAQYSTSDLITQTANLLSPLFAIGICDGIFRFALDANEKIKEVFSSGIFVLLCGAGAFLALSPLLFIFDFVDGYAWLIVVYVLSANVQHACANYIRGKGDTKGFAIQGIVNTALTILFNVIFLVLFGMGVTGYVLSVVVANILVTLLMVFWKRLYCDFSFSFVKASTVKSMLKYSVPMIPTAIFWWITSVSNRFVVKEVCGDAVNGLFAASYKIPTVITLLTTIFIEAWHFSAVNDADDSDRGNFFSTVFNSYMGIIFMAASGLIAFSKICTMILYADSYYSAWQYMPTLILATTFSALTTFMGSVYLVKKKSVMSFLTAMTGALVNLVLSFVLIPRIGAHGAALAAAASYFISFALRTFTAQKFVRFNFHPIKLAVNTAFVSVQAWIMVAELPHWIVYQALLLTAVLIFNGKPILDGIWLVLKKHRTQKS